MSYKFSTKIKLTNDKSAILTTNWLEASVEFQIITEDIEILGGRVDFAEWREFADALEKQFDEFLAANKKILTNGSSEGVKFDLSNTTFTWFLVTEGVKIKYGVVTLSKQEVSVFNTLAEFATIVSSQALSIEKLTDELKTTQSGLAKFEVKFEKTLAERVEAENLMLNKFHALLNSKKKIIESLQDEENN